MSAAIEGSTGRAWPTARAIDGYSRRSTREAAEVTLNHPVLPRKPGSTRFVPDRTVFAAPVLRSVPQRARSCSRRRACEEGGDPTTPTIAMPIARHLADARTARMGTRACRLVRPAPMSLATQAGARGARAFSYSSALTPGALESDTSCPSRMAICRGRDASSAPAVVITMIVVPACWLHQGRADDANKRESRLPVGSSAKQQAGSDDGPGDGAHAGVHRPITWWLRSARCPVLRVSAPLACRLRLRPGHW